MGKFVHLHNHTEFSLLDGANKISDLVAKTKEFGFDAVAITDHGNMYGALQFYTACLVAGIKPIIGCEFYACFDMYKKQGKDDMGHLILLAKNNEGYHNLLKLNSMAFVDGYYYKPRIDYKLLKQYSKGLICLSACLAGHIPQMILQHRYEDAKNFALELNDMFPGDFYLEIQNHGIPEQKEVMVALKKISDETGIKLVATNDCHYLRKEDALTQDILMCVAMGKTYDDPDRMKFQTNEFYYKNYDEMKEAFVGFEDALSTTLEIADKCDVVIKSKAHAEKKLPEKYCLYPNENFIPIYNAPNGQDNYEFFRNLTYDGLKKRYKNLTQDIIDRAEYELGLIKKLGYVEYFLVVWDYINYARSVGIPVGPGRGSGAGSIVAYAIAITSIDPLKYNLFFERFINPERVSMPDFDVDFDVEGRAEVVEYAKRKYHPENVANIGTFGTMAAKNAVKDVARVLKIPYSIADKITKEIPGKAPDGVKPHEPVLKYYFGLSGKEDKSHLIIPSLKEMYDNDTEIKKLIDIAVAVEGMPRQVSVHACGVLIAPEPVDTFVPLQVNKGTVATQYSMTELEQLGLLKMDFLGLNTLTDIRLTLRYIKEDKGIDLDLYDMEYDDQKVYDLISSGNTDAVFQLESGGFKKFLKDLKPDRLEDIIAGVSLYRPGPMAYIDKYVHNKKHPEDVVYAHPCLEPILKTTYGVIVYQEQVMQICQAMGGFSLGQADNVRRIMGKKKKDQMVYEKEKFINGWVDPEGKKSIPGAIKLGIPKEVAEDIFGQMEAFASYAFNKSHAAAYAYVAYQTAYLKTYHELQYLTAVINNRITNADEIRIYINAAKADGIKILPPSINYSKTYFSTENGKIRYGLSGLKGVGVQVIDDIIKEREARGKFKTFQEYINRMIEVSPQAVNKKCIEALIYSGAFDELGALRSQMSTIYESLIAKADRDMKNRATGQESIFSAFGFEDVAKFEEVKMPEIKEFAKNAMLKLEKEVMGIYMSGHPLDDYLDKYQDYNFTSDMFNGIGEAINEADGNIQEDEEEIEQKSSLDGMKITGGGIINEIKKVVTKVGNKEMAIISMEDINGTFDLMLFPNVYKKYKDYLQEDKMYTVNGTISIRDGEKPIIMADSFKEWQDENADADEVVSDKKVYLRFDTTDNHIQGKVDLISKTNPGDCQIIIKCTKNNQAYKYEYKINANNTVINEFIGLLGDGNVIVKENK